MVPSLISRLMFIRFAEMKHACGPWNEANGACMLASSSGSPPTRVGGEPGDEASIYSLHLLHIPGTPPFSISALPEGPHSILVFGESENVPGFVRVGESQFFIGKL